MAKRGPLPGQYLECLGSDGVYGHQSECQASPHQHGVVLPHHTLERVAERGQVTAFAAALCNKTILSNTRKQSSATRENNPQQAS